MMESYETLSEAISALKEQGYSEDFNLRENCLECIAGRQKLLPNEFNIDKSFRFDVDEDPSDQAMLYAISSTMHNIKGLLVNGYGIYSDDLSNEMLQKLNATS
jgi:EAL domain-containing protein (putative c-di-GMP-specific phosphodiesterase class I)